MAESEFRRVLNRPLSHHHLNLKNKLKRGFVAFGGSGARAYSRAIFLKEKGRGLSLRRFRVRLKRGKTIKLIIYVFEEFENSE